MCFVAGGNKECINRSSMTAVIPQSSIPSYFVFLQLNFHLTRVITEPVAIC